MSDLDDEFRYESLQDTNTIVRYLNVISEGIENGCLLFEANQKEVVFKPQGLLKLDIKAKQKERKAKLDIKISWSINKHGKHDKEDGLEIKAGKRKIGNGE